MCVEAGPGDRGRHTGDDRQHRRDRSEEDQQVLALAVDDRADPRQQRRREAADAEASIHTMSSVREAAARMRRTIGHLCLSCTASAITKIIGTTKTARIMRAAWPSGHVLQAAAQREAANSETQRSGTPSTWSRLHLSQTPGARRDINRAVRRVASHSTHSDHLEVGSPRRPGLAAPRRPQLTASVCTCHGGCLRGADWIVDGITPEQEMV